MTRRFCWGARFFRRDAESIVFWSDLQPYFLLEKIGLIPARVSYTLRPVENTLFYEGFIIRIRGKARLYRASRGLALKRGHSMRIRVITPHVGFGAASLQLISEICTAERENADSAS